MNADAIQKICDDYLDYVKSDDYFEDNEWQYYIYETVMRAVHGPDIFERIKNIHKEKAIKKKKKEIAKLQAEIETVEDGR